MKKQKIVDPKSFSNYGFEFEETLRNDWIEFEKIEMPTLREVPIQIVNNLNSHKEKTTVSESKQV